MQINPFGFPLGAGGASTGQAGLLPFAFGDAVNQALAMPAAGMATTPQPGNAAITPAFDASPLLAPTGKNGEAPALPASTNASLLPQSGPATSLPQLLATAGRLTGQAPVAWMTDPAAAPASSPVSGEAPQPAQPQQPVKTDGKTSVTVALPQPPASAAPTDANGIVAVAAEVPAPALEAKPGDVKQTPPRKAGHPDAPIAEAETAKAAAQAAPDTLLAAAMLQIQQAQPAAQAATPVAAQPARGSRSAIGGNPGATTAVGAADPAVGLTKPGAVSEPGNALGNVADATGRDGAGAQTGQGDASDQGEAQPHFATALHRADGQSAFAPTTGAATTAGAAHHTAASEPLIHARANHVGQAMGVEIARKVEAGEDTLRVRLSPENMGKVEITLAFDDGKLQATVRAESARALELLRQDAPELARTLDQAGIRTDAQSFRFESRDGGAGQSSAQNQNSQQQQQQRGQQDRAQYAAEDLDPMPAYRAIRADGQVDLLA